MRSRDSVLFNFTLDEQQDPLSVRLAGRLTLGPQLVSFGRRIAETLAKSSALGMLLDVAEVEEIDSAGLGELVILYTTASQHGCRLCLVRPTPRIVQLLETTKLAGILPCFDDRSTAVAWVDGR